MNEQHLDASHNICSRILEIGGRFAARDAIIFPDYGDAGRLTHARFAELVANAAGYLHAHGVQRGDRVLLCLDNQPELVLFVFGCAWLGAGAVLVNQRLGSGEMAYLLEDSAARCVVTGAAYAPLFAGYAGAVHLAGRAGSAAPLPSQMETRAVDLFSQDFARPPLAPVAETELAFVLYTSGTTSKPKGVMITHAHAAWAARQNIASLGVTEQDVALLFVPLYHTLGFSYMMLSSLLSGGAIVLRRTFHPNQFWDDALTYGCTWTTLFPFILHFLWSMEVPERHAFRFWGYGSRSAETEARFRVQTIGLWGMTELFAIGCSSHGMEVPSLSVGRPIQAFGHRLTNTQPATEPFGTEISGDFEIQGEPGKTLFLGYLNKPEETRAAFTDDGWFMTGDRFFQTHDGIFFYEVRVKDIIRVCGENVSAVEIEMAVYRSGVVKEVAVVSGVDELQGEVPVAFALLADPKADHEQARDKVLAACNQYLAEFKHPREVFFLEDFPRAEIGKIAKKQLRELLATEQYSI